MLQRVSYRQIAAAFILAFCLLIVTVLSNAGSRPAPAPQPVRADTPVSPEKAAETPWVSVFAGSLLPGHSDGDNASARFVKPYGLCMDGDRLLVVDSYNNLIRTVSDGMVGTLAGTVTVADRTGYPMGGYLNGTVDRAVLNRPRFAAVSTQGAVVFSDSGNHMLRVFDGGRVYLLAGAAEPGCRDGGFRAARFNTPSGVAIGSDGTVYIADTLNHCIRLITGDGTVATVAGNPREPGFRDGALEDARFCEPNDITLGADGALYVVDKGNQRIRRIYNGEVSTVAGSGTETDKTTGYIIGGYTDGAGARARFLYPTGLCVSDSGILYVADTGNNCIRAVSPDGAVVTVAGTKTPGSAGGSPGDARFNQPLDVVFADETLYISDSYNHAVRAVRLDEDLLFDTAG